VLTVVKRLFDYVSPDVAVFGLKDAQQVFVVRQMVDTLGLTLRVVEVDTVRDTDGLALSSRNAHLSDTERVHAREIPRALDEAETCLECPRGPRGCPGHSRRLLPA
jgi:pantoate--beta-alanine ligase